MSFRIIFNSALESRRLLISILPIVIQTIGNTYLYSTSVPIALSVSRVVRLMFNTVVPSKVRSLLLTCFRGFLFLLPVQRLFYTLRTGLASSRGRLLNNTFLSLLIFAIISTTIILYLVIRILLAKDLSRVAYLARQSASLTFLFLFSFYLVLLVAIVLEGPYQLYTSLSQVRGTSSIVIASSLVGRRTQALYL